MEGWRQWRLGKEKSLVQRKNKRIDLTPTGLLMEGHFTQNLLRQLDYVRMFAVALVFVGQYLLQPLSLAGCCLLVCQPWIMENRKFLSAAFTPKSSHIAQVGRSLSRLPLLDG